MITARELGDFYRDDYWSSRGDGKTLLRHRDFRHFLFLRDHLPSADSNEIRKAVNFGSGHAGMSRLLVAAGFELTNVDFFDAQIPVCRHVADLKFVDGPVDLVYASHSLEHVADLTATIQAMINLLRPGGLMFVEVPDATDPSRSREVEGLRVPDLDPPHTYYMSRQFFEELSLELVSLEVHHGVVQFLGRRGLKD